MHSASSTPTHDSAGHTWALVLAAGEGTRLQALTMTPAGVAVPKQFCSLNGGTSLLHSALRRAAQVSPPQRTCAVVAQQHQRWWQALPQSVPSRNIIVQPRNRGTANGILLPLLQIVRRDPQASLLVLPSDHFVHDEPLLARSLRQAITQLEQHQERIVLLGLQPDEPDPELGYIVPANDSTAPLREVRQFIEKPSVATARLLLEQGGLWNSFIFAVRGSTLLRAFEARCPDIVAQMRGITAANADSQQQGRLSALYEQLPMLDFSRDLIQRIPEDLSVLTVPACGWSDLGTPQRVARTLDLQSAAARCMPAAHAAGFLDLSVQHRQLRRTA